MEELSDTLLNQLYKTNCPIRYEEENNRYIIDVKAVASCSNFLVPFAYIEKVLKMVLKPEVSPIQIV